MPPQGRPQAAGRSSHTSFSQVSTIFFQATRKPARSQPEASQKPTKLFFDSQKPAKPGKRGLIWQGSLGLAGS